MHLVIKDSELIVRSLYVLKEIIQKNPAQKDYIYSELIKSENFNSFVHQSGDLVQLTELYPEKKVHLLEQALKNPIFVNNIRSHGRSGELKRLTTLFSGQNDLILQKIFNTKENLEKYVFRMDQGKRRLNYDALAELTLAFPNYNSSIFKSLFPSDNDLQEYMTSITYLGSFVELFPEREEYFFKIKFRDQQDFNALIHNLDHLLDAIKLFPNKAEFLLDMALKSRKFIENISLMYKRHDRKKTDFEELVVLFPKEKKEMIYAHTFAEPSFLKKNISSNLYEKFSFSYDKLKIVISLFPDHKLDIFENLFPKSATNLFRELSSKKLKELALIFPEKKQYIFDLTIKTQEQFNSIVKSIFDLFELLEGFPEQAEFLLRRALWNQNILNNIKLDKGKRTFTDLVGCFPKENDLIYARTFGIPNILAKHIYHREYIIAMNVEIIVNLFPKYKNRIFEALLQKKSSFETLKLWDLSNLVNTFTDFKEEIYQLTASKTEFLNKNILITNPYATHCYSVSFSNLTNLVDVFPEHGNEIFYILFPDLDTFRKWIRTDEMLQKLAAIFPDKKSLQARNLNNFIQERLISSELTLRREEALAARKACIEVYKCFAESGVLDVLPPEIIHEIFAYVFPKNGNSYAKERRAFVYSIFAEPPKSLKEQARESVDHLKKNCSIM